MYDEMVTSPYEGVVQDILVNKNGRIYEWEPLFLIKGEKDQLYSVKAQITGEVQSLEVQRGDSVIPGMVLAYVREEISLGMKE
ncbi:biotin carboxyl carrier protein [Bacillus ectoiniformans]|uniref:hypothetical protein n=1 Tax=Bacillus ectoiniformans TaxID=1494429 RepID=UPI001959A2A7|nr:hypothetical protein [Bacillus ectoiniformans]MBM7649452.1 biotin carboxyl carrier protein [Bacillus ectoiniformans]